jgi:hypothetical protein
VRADFLATGLGLLLAERLDLADVQALLDDLACHRLRIGLIDQCARVSGRQLAGVDVGLHRVGQSKQSQRVGDVAAALADDPGDFVLRMIELGRQHLIAGRLLERIEISALHVLDDRKLQRFGVAGVEHDHRHLVQAGALRGAPASLAGDDLVAVGAAHAHNDRLDDAALTD